jgi:hypothetical protein
MTRVLVASALALALLAAPASAATLSGTVVAPPAVHGKQAVVPLLSSAGKTLKVVLPAHGAIRAAIGRLAPDQLRYGDTVVVSGARLSGVRPHARILRVGKRGPTLTFRAIAARRKDTLTKVQAALDRVTTLAKTASQITGVADAEPADTRAKLLAVRTDVNYAISDLRDQATALDGVVAGAKPVERGKDTELAALGDTAATARKAADDLDTAVGGLDETINAVGGASAPPLPINLVGSVSDVLHQVLDLLRKLPGANPTG